jgi:hypothetical protein
MPFEITKFIANHHSRITKSREGGSKDYFGLHVGGGSLKWAKIGLCNL